MDKIEQQIKRFNKIDIWLVVKNIIDQNEDFLIGLIRSQLLEGKDKYGKLPEYSPASRNYVKEKLNSGKIASSTLPNMNLFYTGAFQESMKVLVKDKVIEISSNDSKSDDLQGRYGVGILEPNEERMQQLVNFILPKLQNKLRKQLGY